MNQLAHGLLSLGVEPGDPVTLMVGNRIEHLETIFAAAKIGALVIPLGIKWKALELGSVVSIFKPSLLILQNECIHEFEKAAATHDLSLLRPLVITDPGYGGLLNCQSVTELDVHGSENDPFAVLFRDHRLSERLLGHPPHLCFSLHQQCY